MPLPIQLGDDAIGSIFGDLVNFYSKASQSPMTQPIPFDSCVCQDATDSIRFGLLAYPSRFASIDAWIVSQRFDSIRSQNRSADSR